LIVEVARQQEKEGQGIVDAVVEACRLRLRPILMTSLAFILGVLPLVMSEGAGSEMRQAVGSAVFFGMIGVTLFGLLFTPVFYVLIRRLAGGERKAFAQSIHSEQGVAHE
jgi:multidrug efflux pump subunit AcrB